MASPSKSKLDEIRALAESDLYIYATLIGAGRVYGQCHRDSMAWLSRPGASPDQLLLDPRGHLKSHTIAVWCSWWITKNPHTTILYVSGTEDLAISQLSVIKNHLESDVHRRYWPDLINKEEAKRARWAMKDIKVDHPRRAELGVRDSTVAARGIGANTAGHHCDVLVLDDIVVPENAYTEDGRRTVQAGYGQFASVLNPGGITKVVGTRYHAKDIYGVMQAMTQEIFDEKTGSITERKVFEVLERPVETDGNFLWPRQQHPDTRMWFGFDQATLAKIRAKYFAAGERAQYYSQYYHRPNDDTLRRLAGDSFLYYDRKHLRFDDGVWLFKDKPLVLFAGGDIAYTTQETSDYTAFAVIGLDHDGFIYILELDQMKTDKYERYYQSIEKLHAKWRFKRMMIETNSGANVIARYIQDRIREDGLPLVVEGRPSRANKAERTAAILEPRYENKSILHYQGGVMAEYEEQIVLPRPRHDDLKDAVTIAVEISKPPVKHYAGSTVTQFTSHPRFGGRIRVS